MEIRDIFFPVTKVPVPPDEVDLLKIVLLESIFQKGEDGVVKEFRKIYYETSFQGKKVSDGNNIIPSELIPLIFDSKNNLQMMDYAMQGFGFAINHEVFTETPDVFSNPYTAISNNLISQPNQTIQTNPTNETNQPTNEEESINEPTTTEPTGAEPPTTEPTGTETSTTNLTPAN